MKNESKNLEWKQTLTKEVKHEIVSFLNSSSGVIEIGIDNDGKAFGVPLELKDEFEQTISNWIREGIYPDSKGLINFYYDKRNVLRIEISEGNNKPYYLVGKGPISEGVFIRIGSTTRKATKEEISEFYRKHNDGHFETEGAPNQDLHFTQFSAISDRQDFVPKMNALGFYTKDNKYTKLAELLSDENPYIVKFAVYKDNTRVEFKVKKEFAGSYLRIIDNVLDYAEIYNDTSAKIVDYQPQRVELKSYPAPSIRETLLNALCHCDFSFRSNIKIEFFNDRLEVTSPGNIYGGYTLEDVLSGKQSMRNPNLVNILDKMDFIENYATGLERIMEAYKPYKITPKFEVSGNFFRVILPNMNYSLGNMIEEKPTNMSPNVTKSNQTLSNVQNKIIEQIRKDSNITVSELSEIIGKERRTILRNIKKLKEQGLLDRKDDEYSGSWILK
ncbi:Transcriptional regulator [Alteracholeplasma palmae J233]|uniref:Transcriptional regulator n=1 Tax=Alteracholeplasma palmae (strain ATCC 49389 / J233) TaxID=1318466 RepID=U4KJX9_ALTPJ|nr:ATP-binding protein [Alteracholeplasma palmae]CCV63782.1 Transcriptional regulator [Alteracholeplasma palmae J233]